MLGLIDYLSSNQILDHFERAFSDEKFAMTDAGFNQVLTDCKQYIKRSKRSSDNKFIRFASNRSAKYEKYWSDPKNELPKETIEKYQRIEFGFKKLFYKLTQDPDLMQKIRNGTAVIVGAMIAFGLLGFGPKESKTDFV